MAADKPEKTRTRRASSQPAASPQRHPVSVAPGDSSHLSGVEAKLNRILVRLDGLESGVATLKEAVSATNDSVNDTNALVSNTSDSVTTIVADGASFRTGYDADIARLTGLLEETRRDRDSERRQNLIVSAQLASAVESNRRLEAQLNTLENRSRVRNIRLDGKQEVEGEDLFKYVADIANKIGVNSLARGDIAAVYRIGSWLSDGRARLRPRTIMIVFSNENARNRLFFARTKLKNVDWLRGVYLNDDVTVVTRKQREDYRSVAALARSLHADVRVHTDGILLDGVKYRLTESHTLPAKFSVERAKTVEEGGELYFSSEYSFLSNFSPSPIVVGDTVFHTAEHMYQSLKCKHSGDEQLKDRIIVAPTPLEAKRLADGVKESPEWRANRDAVMTRVIQEKFAQNPHLAAKLMKTGDRKLNEATRNDHFGIGVNLHAREISDKSYRGTNMLGNILMAQRDLLRTGDAGN